MSNNIHTHTFTDFVVPPTCTEKGYTLHKCDCGYNYKSDFTETDKHTFEIVEEIAPTCTEKGARTVRCTRCGEVKKYEAAALGHDWGNWSVQAVATCTSDGKQIRVCSRCGQVEEREVKAMGHKFSKPKKSKDQKGKVEYFCQNCGKTFIGDANTKRNLKTILLGVVLPLILVAAITTSCVLASLDFLKAKTPDFKQEFLYSIANIQLARNKDTSAYFILAKCADYKDSKEMLKDFEIKFKNIEFDDGSKQEYIFDNDGNILSDIYYYAYDGSTRKYLYYADGRLQSKAWYNKAGECTKLLKPTIEKDEKGRIISEVWEDDGSVEKTEIVYTDDGGRKEIKSDYYYNSDKIDTKYETTYDKNDKVTLKVRSYYDENGNLQEKRETNQKYDDKGNGLSSIEVSYNAQGDINYKIETQCTYDDKGNMTLATMECYNAENDAIMKEEYKITYDDKGNLSTGNYLYSENGKPIGEYEATFDIMGNLLTNSTIYYDEDGNVDATEKETYKYTYDNYGNMTSEKCYTDDVLEREYIYEYDYDDASLKTTYKYYDEDGNVEDTTTTKQTNMVAFYKPGEKEELSFF